MMTVVAIVAFGGGLGLALLVLGVTFAPNLDRIAAALRGEMPASFNPLATLVHAERRIAVRRWAAGYQPVPLRAAA